MLAIIFIVLKLLGHIEWSWLWILAPLWIPWVIVGLVFGIALAIGAIGMWLEDRL